MSGGNPDTLDFPGFLEISYALLAEEHQRINPLKDFLSLSQDLGTPMRKDVLKTTVAASNEGSMAALMGRLSDVPNAPTKKRPRRA